MKAQITRPYKYIEHYNIKDEHVYRELAESIIKEIPFEKLQELFRFTKVDPRKLGERSTLAESLKQDGLILYKAETKF